MTTPAIGPYCPWPRDVWDGTCVHPSGSARIVAELRNEHRRRHGDIALTSRLGILGSLDGPNTKPNTETEGPCSAACDTRYLRR